MMENVSYVWVTCWECRGEGGFHDCGEDTCCCLEPDLNEDCPTCKGEGEVHCEGAEAMGHYDEDPSE
jgi:hypothetical protein